MEKYVQVRLEAVVDNKAFQELRHDFRIVAVDYLRNEYEHNKYNNIELLNNSDFNAVKKAFKNIIKKNKENYYKYKKRNMRIRDANFMRGIITLSNSIIQELKEGKVIKQELEEAFRSSLESVKKQIESKTGDNVEVIYNILHYDEKTPHVHFLINNRTKEGKSIYFKIKKKEILSSLQDAAEQGFKNLGYRRGISKTISNRKHLTVKEMHQAELKQIRKIIDITVKDLQAKKKEIQAENKELAKEKEKNWEEIQKNNKEKKKIQEEINNLKNKKKEIYKSEEEYINKVFEDIKEIYERNEGIVFTNKEQIIKEITAYIYNKNIEIKEVENIKEENKELRETIEIKNIEINKLKDVYNNLKEKYLSIKKELKKYIQPNKNKQKSINISI